MALVRSLTALTGPVSTDVLYIVDDPSGTPADRKVEVGKLLRAGTGVDLSTDNAAAQTLSATTWTKLTCNANTTVSTYRPTWASTSLWDASNNRLKLTDVPVGTMLIIYPELSWSPAGASTLRLRLAHDSAATASPITAPTRVTEYHLATASTGTLTLGQPMLLYVDSTVKASYVEIQAYTDTGDDVNLMSLGIVAHGIA